MTTARIDLTALTTRTQVSKVTAHYRPAPPTSRACCGTCVNMTPDCKCTRVQGTVQGDYLCDLYQGSKVSLSAGHQRLIDLTPQTPTASTVPEPFAKSPLPGLWHVGGMQLPPYVQHVAHALLAAGHAKTESQAIAMAKGAIADWLYKGTLPNHKHYHTHSDVRAAAAKAIAQWHEKQAEAHAHAKGGGGGNKRRHHFHLSGGTPMGQVDLAGAKMPKLLTGAARQNEAGRKLLEGGKIVPESGQKIPESGKVVSEQLDTIAQTKYKNYQDSKAALGENHPHTQELKAAFNAHIAGQAEHQARLVSHLQNVHRMSNSTLDGATTSSLENMHTSDHIENPGMTHRHTSGLSPKPKKGNVDMSQTHTTKVHFDAWGNRVIDLATTTVKYPTGTEVKHSTKGPGGTTTIGPDGKATHKSAGKGKGQYVGFNKLVQRIMKQGKSLEEAQAIAAKIGRAKYGTKKFNAASAAGKKMGGK